MQTLGMYCPARTCLGWDFPSHHILYITAEQELLLPFLLCTSGSQLKGDGGKMSQRGMLQSSRS